MDEYGTDTGEPAAPETTSDSAVPVAAASDDKSAPTEQETALVTRILKTIKDDKEFHRPAFDRMKKDMFLATHGREEEWATTSYVANIIGRHIKQKTAALYAKNPKATAKRRETLDFAVWDENPDSLKLAFQTIQTGVQAQQAAAQQDMQAPTIDPVTGVAIPTQAQLPPGFEQAQALIKDFQQGLQRRETITKIGKTLEILYAHAIREQKPLDFKMAMKQLVRRVCTTGVGFVELGFQRQMGPRPGLTEQLADTRQRLDHLAHLKEELAEGEIEDTSAEAAELQNSLASLQAEPQIVLREGLIFDFPQSTKVIPDRLCKSLVGFVGARHITIEYLFTTDEVEELFPGSNLGKDYAGYGANGANSVAQEASSNQVPDGQVAPNDNKGKGLVCVWKHYDKPSGLVYYVADGHKTFLRPPAAPDVMVSDFWPVYALTFNAVENEKDLYPPSDAKLLYHMQMEYNRSRQGMREHRKAARPRWAVRESQLDVEDIDNFKAAKPFDVIVLKADPSVKLTDLLEAIPVPGVDPNLYETNQLFTDIQLVGGSQEAQYGATTESTATQASIAANSTASSDNASIDDLDGFLSAVARGGGQILMGNMSEEQVVQQVGPGAVWPQQSLAEIAEEIYLDIEAGSSGNPNQAVEIDNWTKLLPFIIQMPGISPNWIARETIRRLDDKADLVEALSAGIPSIVMQNQSAQPGTGDPATNPAQQGPAGASKVPLPVKPAGDAAPMLGNNQM